VIDFYRLKPLNTEPGTDQLELLFIFKQQEEHMEAGIIDKFQKQREELNRRRAFQAWHELKQKDK